MNSSFDRSLTVEAEGLTEGGSSDLKFEFEIKVTELPIQRPIVILSGPTPQQNTTPSYTFTANDPVGDALTALQDCGDNRELSTPFFSPATGEGGFICTFADVFPPFTASVTVTAEDGRTGTAAKFVGAPPVSVSLDPQELTVNSGGGTVDFSVSMRNRRFFAGACASYSGGPQGSTAQFFSEFGPCSLDDDPVTMRVTVPSAAPSGSYPFSVTATSCSNLFIVGGGRCFLRDDATVSGIVEIIPRQVDLRILG